MPGNRTASLNNKELLKQTLGLSQVSNTSVFIKKGYFVLSPSIQNNYSWFDIREVNVSRYRSQAAKGYLLIRFFEKFLLAELDPFIEKMIRDDNSVETKVSGVHWKFNISKSADGYTIVNMTNKNRFYIKEVTVEELKDIFAYSIKAILHEEKEHPVQNVNLVAVAKEKPHKNFFQFLFGLFRRK